MVYFSDTPSQDVVWSLLLQQKENQQLGIHGIALKNAPQLLLDCHKHHQHCNLKIEKLLKGLLFCYMTVQVPYFLLMKQEDGYLLKREKL